MWNKELGVKGIETNGQAGEVKVEGGPKVFHKRTVAPSSKEEEPTRSGGRGTSDFLKK